MVSGVDRVEARAAQLGHYEAAVDRAALKCGAARRKENNMSADNWTYCPRCEVKAETDRIAFEEKVKKSYGKVSAEEYLRLTDQLKNPKRLEQTLREDYELGTNEGFFNVSYRAGCSVCNFSFEFHEEKKIAPQNNAETASTDKQQPHAARAKRHMPGIPARQHSANVG